MAEVLTPVLSSSSTITMLHTPADAFSNSSAHQSSRPQMSRYNGSSGGSSYRGPAAVPVAPYAFQSTPHLRQDNRSLSSPGPNSRQNNNLTVRHGQSGPSLSSISTVSTSSSSSFSLNGQHIGSKDDSVLQSRQRSALTVDARPASAVVLSTSAPNLTLSPPTETTVKTSPERYRRTAQRMNSGPPSPGLAPSASQPTSAPTTATVPDATITPPIPVRPGHLRTSSDDSSLARIQSEQAKRYRRRSLGNISPSGSQITIAPVPAAVTARPASPITRPAYHQRTGSNDSRTSSSSRPTSRASSGVASSPSSRPPSRPSSRPSSRHDSSNSASTIRSVGVTAGATMVNVPPRASSNFNKPLAGSSPLSRPVDLDDENIPAAPLNAKPSRLSEVSPAPLSPAAQRLTEVSDRDLNRGMKSRLRRAFSFGSSAELKRVSAHNVAAERAKHNRENSMTEEEARDAAIAAQQEAAGIGNAIYSGQGGVFAASTDNVSISSTASSASIMLRKMGRGVKKGTKSIRGLFRPKSVIGVPAADSAVTRTGSGLAEVSMVTVEAETQRVNVNSDPHDHAGGGTGYPKLERNSLDASSISGPMSPMSPMQEISSRKSIIGGDRERQEVLNAVKKGILKRTNTDSPSPTLRTGIYDSTPPSSQPSTPADDRSSAPDVSRIDYFEKVKSGSTRSLPTTQNRNISFNQRIQFFDAWSSTEYDRRGEIATCNRLTPMLAQQIKEELNSFKMEMEVHEQSKPHTHFF